MKNTYDLAIIGGGAAGLSACAAASRAGDRVVILEGASSIGRKIMASGNGRCNLSHDPVSAEDFRGSVDISQ